MQSTPTRLGPNPIVTRVLAALGLSPSRNLYYLAAAAFFYMYGMAAQNSVGNNFQVETLQMTAADRGLMEGARELPGLLLVFISALTVAMPVPKLASLSIGTMALQYFGFSFVTDVWQLIALTAFGSIGAHLWFPLQRELNLSIGDKSRSGRALGFMAGVGAAGGLAGMISVYIWAPSLGYRQMFLWAAFSLAVATILVGRVKSPRRPEHEKRARFVLRREYTFYYLLNFLDGSTRQIWTSFAMFTIVKHFGVDVRTVTMMLIVNSLVTVFMNPRIGAWIDQWGERKALMVGFGGLVVVFATYALNTEAWVAIGIYFTYQTMHAFNMGVPSYLHKIARPGDLSPSLAMGVTFEHLAGIAIPVVGGVLWVTYGYRYAFLVGALVAGISFLVVTRLPKGKLVEAGAEPA